MAKRTFYDAFQVSRNADPETIRTAYKSLAQRYHPDNPEGEKFLKILNRAYEVLSDPAKRAGYDAALADDDEDQPEQSRDETFTKNATATEVNIPADDPAQASVNGDTALYEAAIGEKNTTYYLAKFEQFDQQGTGLKPGWNWPAFVLGGTWALYRKMYGWFFAFFGIIFLSNLFEKTGSPVIGAIIFIGPWVAFTIYANSLYHGKVSKKIAAARLTLRDESRLLAYLRQAGGVHAWVIWVFGFVPIIGIVAAITIPAYHDYQKRAVAQQSQQPATDWEKGEMTPPGGSPPQNQQAATEISYEEAVSSGGASPQTQLSMPTADIIPDGPIVDPFLDSVKKAAAQGDGGAQYNLGLRYAQGQGVAQDYAEAIKWFRLAAAQGHAKAQYNLGIVYYVQGQGVAQDYAEAVKWFRLAAAQGYADAQFNLGSVYAQGQGVAQDYIRAYLWSNLAAAQGSAGAAMNRDKLVGLMTPQQIAQAQKMASECQQRNFKNCD